MNIQPEHELSPKVNDPGVPSGWTKMYTREGLVRLVPENEIDNALRDGLLPQPFDLDASLAEFLAAVEDARVSVPKALAESIATGFNRDEDAWIITHSMTRVRDSFAVLMFTAGALLPTQADIHAIREYIDNEPKRAELKAQVEALVAAGKDVPEGLEKNASGSSYYRERAEKYAKALGNLPADAHAALMAHADEDKAHRDATAVSALQLRVRSLQIADPPVPVELENGVMMRRDTDTGILRPADPNTGEFLPEVIEPEPVAEPEQEPKPE